MYSNPFSFGRNYMYVSSPRKFCILTNRLIVYRQWLNHVIVYAERNRLFLRLLFHLLQNRNTCRSAQVRELLSNNLFVGQL